MKQLTNKKYVEIHLWLSNTFGKAIACENPECEHTSKTFHYALRAGKTHKKLRSNYMTLCQLCHRRYDIKHNNVGHVKDRTPRLSMTILYKMAQRYTVENPRKNTPEIIQFLEYVNQHKNDIL